MYCYLCSQIGCELPSKSYLHENGFLALLDVTTYLMVLSTPCTQEVCMHSLFVKLLSFCYSSSKLGKA